MSFGAFVKNVILPGGILAMLLLLPASAQTNQNSVLAPAPAPQTAPRQAPAPDDNQEFTAAVKVFQLAHLSPKVASNIILDLFSSGNSPGLGEIRVAVDERSSALIVTGSNNALMVVEALLLRLDVPDSTSDEERSLLQVFQLRNLPASVLSDALSVLQLKNLRMKSDSVGNKLIVHGHPDEINKVKDLVQILDEGDSQSKLNDPVIRVVWLVDESLAPEDAAPVPVDLMPAVMRMTDRTGLGALRTAAQMMVSVTAVDVGQFVSSGSVELTEHCEMQVKGRLDTRTGRIEIEIQASDAASNVSLCSLSTIVRATPGRPVILGMTPVGSKPCLFVIELIEMGEE